MLKVGLTGGIGSGKSTVAAVFGVLGIPIYSSDLGARRLMNEDSELIKAIKTAFGKQTYKDGRLDRARLAAVVFNDKDKLAALNAIVHPATILDGKRWMDAQSGVPYAIKESSLIFEAGMQPQFDFIIGVSAPDPLRIKRVMERDNISANEVRHRMKNQVQVSIKLLLCDAVIFNDEEHAVIPQVLALHQRLST
jgi:dephospho-CoA kinase